MSMSNGVTGGNFVTEADMQASGARVDTNVTVTVAGVRTIYLVEVADGGSGVLLDNGLYANPTEEAQVATLKKRTPASGVITFIIGVEYFLTANATVTMPDVTGFTGGERFKVVASIAAVSSTITVDGTQSELIKTTAGGSDTVFNLTNTGVSFEFIFNALTGHWEV